MWLDLDAAGSAEYDFFYSSTLKSPIRKHLDGVSQQAI